jgi:predicted nucleic acid-binding protein
VPDTVWEEVLRHRPGALRRKSILLHRISEIPEPTPELAHLLLTNPLDAGETEAFKLLEQHPKATLLTDDGPARLLAIQLNYAVHGTIGVLLRGREYALLTRAKLVKLIAEIPRRSTLYIDKTILRSIIEQVRGE